MTIKKVDGSFVRGKCLEEDSTGYLLEVHIALTMAATTQDQPPMQVTKKRFLFVPMASVMEAFTEV
jgi:hypothetical protein